MSTFLPNIPQPQDDLDESQPQILANNQALDAIFGVDHFPFSNVTSNQGHHQWVTLPPQGSPPAAPSVTDSLRLFNQLALTLPNLYMRRQDGGVFPVSPINSNSESGSVQLSNIIIKWGKVTASVGTSGTIPVTFDTNLPFLQAPYIVIPQIGSAVGSTGYCYADTFTTGGCTIHSQTNGTGSFTFYYLAIGSASV